MDCLRSRDLVDLGAIGGCAEGTLRKAFHTPSLTMLAVKSVVLPEVDEHVRDTLRQELELLAIQQCDHVVQLYGVFYDDGRLHLCHQHMGRGSLFDVVERHGPMPEALVQKIASSVASGLQHYHDREEAHGNIKPGSILVDGNGGTRVANIGNRIIQTLTSDDSQRQNSVATDTGAHVLPASSSDDAHSRADDVWALGTYLVFCSLGRFPDSGDENVTQEMPLLSDECCDFVEKCLLTDPHERWTCEQLLQHPFLSREIDEEDIDAYFGAPGDHTDESEVSDLDIVCNAVRENYYTREGSQYTKSMIDISRLRRVKSQLNLSMSLDSVIEHFEACLR